MAGTVEKIEFQAEVRQVLEIVIHSLYTHKEIFLRELISNASDAMDKRRFEALTRTELAPEGDKYELRIETEKDKRTLTVTDDGIGMSRDDLTANLGTIAKSGTQEFLRAARAKKGEGAPELIGQFGVGFYAAFMVADTVEVRTRRAGDEKGWLWRSQGEGGFTIEEAPDAPVGTAVKLSLKSREAGDQDFAEPDELKAIVKKYSDFITYPILMQDGKEPVNSMKAIWTKAAKDIKAEEHAEFYRHIGHDWNEPLESIRFSAEGASLSFDALLYLPAQAGADLFYPERRGGVHLYVKRVLIMDDCKDLTPDYLRFVRGVVDCPDIPLNISRETMQLDRQLKQIRDNVVRKVIGTLEKLLSGDREKYVKFWGAFGKVLKEGLFSDKDNRDRLKDLLLFECSGAEGLSTLKDYVGRMKDGQKEIYYILGESRAAVENSPHLEALKAKGYEVAFFTDPVDEVVLDHVREYDGKTLRSAGRGDLGLGTDKEALEKKQKDFKSLLDYLSERLKDYVKEVRFSDRLRESAVCLVAPEGGMSARLEKMLRASQQSMPENKRIMELNPSHPVVESMKAMFDKDNGDPKLDDYAFLLYGQGALTEGSAVPDPARYARLVAELMSEK